MRVRNVNGEFYYSVAEVADAVGVSAQTVREWELLGHFTSHRSPGGHRLFSEKTLEQVRSHALLRRRAVKVFTDQTRSRRRPELVDWDLASTGARVSAAREAAGLSQAALATKAGISRSLLSNIERGVSGPSLNVFSRLADILGIPMALLAPARPVGQRVMRIADRPSTVLAGGVSWQELAAPGHSLAPALLLAEPAANSGGYVVVSRENFVLVAAGAFIFKIESTGEEVALNEGDSLVIPAGSAHSWRNASADLPARALWVEQLAAWLPAE